MRAPFDLDALPFLGLGLSSNLSRADVPQPYRLLDSHRDAFDYLEYSAPLDLEQARREASLFDEMFRRRATTPVLFHPVHLNLWGPELESARSLQALAEHARAVSSPWVGNDVAWWHSRGAPFPGYVYVAPPLSSRALDECVRHAEHVQAALDRPLLLENPAVFAPRGALHVLDFFSALHARTGLGLILDVGHLLSHQLARGLPLDAGFDGFAFEAVIEIHLAGGVIVRRGDRSFYVDDHPQPVREEAWELLDRVLPRCRRLRALTYEGDGHPEWLASRNLARLRRTLEARGASPAERAPATASSLTSRQAPSPTSHEDSLADAWTVFDVAHGVSTGDDAAADTMEIDHRLAVVAEQIDRVFPLTRALVASTRDELASFLASREHRAAFTARSRSLAEAFASWAEARVEDDGIAAVLAIERFVAEAPPPPRPDETKPVRLAEGVAILALPKDLSTVLHARAAIDRHLGARARATGRFDASGFEGVRHATQSLPDGPWPVAVRRRASIEILPLSIDAHDLLVSIARGWTEDDFARAKAEHPREIAELVRRGLLVTTARRA